MAGAGLVVGVVLVEEVAVVVVSAVEVVRLVDVVDGTVEAVVDDNDVSVEGEPVVVGSVVADVELVVAAVPSSRRARSRATPPRITIAVTRAMTEA